MNYVVIKISHKVLFFVDELGRDERDPDDPPARKQISNQSRVAVYNQKVKMELDWPYIQECK